MTTNSLLKRLRTSSKKDESRGAKKRRLDSAASVAAKIPAANPFEAKHSKLKHEVVGRKVRGTDGRPFSSRKKAYDIRKEKLLGEYAGKSRVSQFLDRRFGEEDGGMSVEEKMLKRFMKQRQSNSERFKLEDENLTHYGQSLSNKDYELSESESDDEDFGQIDEETVHESHFGGFEESQVKTAGRRSKADVMRQLIVKSKLHKYERQKTKDDDELARKDLDSGIADLKSLLQVWQDDKNQNGASGATSEKSRVEDLRSAVGNSTAPMSYDVLVRQLAFDRRSQPSNKIQPVSEAPGSLKRVTDKERGAAHADRFDGDGLGSEDYVGDLEPVSERPLTYQNGMLVNAVDFSMRTGGVSRDGVEDSEEEDVEEEVYDQQEEDDGRQDDEEEDEKDEDVQEKVDDPGLLADSEYDVNIGESGHPLQLPTSQEELDHVLRRKTPEGVARYLDLQELSQSSSDVRLQQLKRFLVALLQHLAKCLDQSADWELFVATSRHIVVLAKRFPQVTHGYFSAFIRTATKVTPVPPLPLSFFFHMSLLFTLYPASGVFHPLSTPARLVVAGLLSSWKPKSARSVVEGLWLCKIVPKHCIVPEVFLFLQCMIDSLSRDVSVSREIEMCISMIKDILLATCNAAAETAVLWEFLNPLLLSLRSLTQGNKFYADLYMEIGTVVTKTCSQRSVLQLQAFKPLPIKSFVPKFEANYSFDRSKPRLQTDQKLRASYKKEVKGAVRELKKDNAFIAETRLKDVRQKDAAYKERMRKIMGQLGEEQGEKKKAERLRRK